LRDRIAEEGDAGGPVRSGVGCRLSWVLRVGRRYRTEIVGARREGVRRLECHDVGRNVLIEEPVQKSKKLSWHAPNLAMALHEVLSLR